MRIRTAAYWMSTVFVVLELLVGGVTDLVHGRELLVTGEPVVSVLAHLGYPPYLLTILGTWKLLAVAALIAPGFPRLKEWAYAGAFFEMTGAVASHLAHGDGPGSVLTLLVMAALLLVSWALRPPSRRLARTASPPPPAPAGPAASPTSAGTPGTPARPGSGGAPATTPRTTPGSPEIPRRTAGAGGRAPVPSGPRAPRGSLPPCRRRRSSSGPRC